MPTNNPSRLLVALSVAGLAACSSMDKKKDTKTASAPPAPPAAAVKQPDARLDWWRDARFGMFIHWGLYAIPAGKWGDQTNHAEWIRTTAKIPLTEYDQFVGRFNPVKFNADQWVSMAKDAGCKYIVITSKHHDGFALFDSKHSDFDVMATPFRRDIMRELSDACRRQGVVQCWYHSIMDWHHPDYLPRRDWEKDRPTEGADYNRFNRYLTNQVTELLANYGPIGVMWFDGEWEDTWTPERGDDLYALCRRLQPSVIVNNRVSKGRAGMAGMTVGAHAGDFGTPEQEIPATGMPGVDWETCMTMNDHWGYNAADKDFKTTEDLIHKLCDIASKGGNFLLNVGPTAEGEIPPESVQRLRDMGRWMKINGEAIYGTAASPLADLDFGRCTAKATPSTTTLYLHVFKWPEGGVLRVDGLASMPTRAYLLADRSRNLATGRDGSAVSIILPTSAPDPICSVMALEIQGKPEIYLAPDIAAAADEFIRVREVRIAGSKEPGVVVRYTTDGSDPSGASLAYDSPFLRIADTTTVKARVFKGGRPVSPPRTRQFRKVDPAPAVGAAPVEKGLAATIYKGEWDKLPDFGAQTPESSKVVTKIRPDNWIDERIGYRFSGFISIPEDEVYEFAVTSDDGARLVIDGRTVVDNDGLHSSVEKKATAALAKGWHAVTVDWFNKTGDATLVVKYAPAGGKLEQIPEGMMGH